MKAHFFNSIKNALFMHRKSAGISMYIEGENMSYDLVVLERKKEEIQIITQQTNIENLEILSSKLPEKIPVSLSINGRGVLHKKLPDGSDEQLLHAVFPNADPEQFYIQKKRAKEGIFCSVIRRKKLDQICQEFANKNIWLIDIRLGIFNLHLLWSYLGKPGCISTNKHQLFFDKSGNIETFKNAADHGEQNYSLGGDMIPAALIQAYSNSLSLFIAVPSSFNHPIIEQTKREYQYKQVFDKSWKYVLGFIGVIVLINSSFFYYYKNKNQQLSGVSTYAFHQIAELDTLKKRAQQQKKIIESTNVNQSTDLSFYADQIGKSLPEGMQLNSFNIFPMLGSERDYEQGSLIKYNSQNINIKGKCNSSLVYNKWIKQLEELDWVNKVQHLEYKDVDKTLAEFELQIIITEAAL